MVGQEVTDEGSGEALDQLWFFMAAQRSRPRDFFALKRMPAGASRAAWKAARPAVYPASGGAQVASPQSPIRR